MVQAPLAISGLKRLSHSGPHPRGGDEVALRKHIGHRLLAGDRLRGNGAHSNVSRCGGGTGRAHSFGHADVLGNGGDPFRLMRAGPGIGALQLVDMLADPFHTLRIGQRGRGGRQDVIAERKPSAVVNTRAPWVKMARWMG
jgi:hypothetical protein